VFLIFFLHLCTGGLPGPVLFGFAMDHSCLLWEQKCDGSTGACLYYDNHQMAWLLMAVCVACKLLNIVCGLFSWRLYMKRVCEGDVTGNGPTGNNVKSAADQASGVSNPAAEAETDDL